MAEAAIAFDSHRFVTDKRLAATDERIAESIPKLNKRIEETKVELIKWMAGMLVAVVIAISGLIISLINFL